MAILHCAIPPARFHKLCIQSKVALPPTVVEPEVDIGLVEVSRDLALVIVRFVETWRKAGVRSVSTCRDLT